MLYFFECFVVVLKINGVLFYEVAIYPPPMSNRQRSGNAEDATLKAIEAMAKFSRKVTPPQAASFNPFKEAPYITKARHGLEALFNIEA